MNGPEGSSSAPVLPETGDVKPFAEPWQAQAFAIVLVLHERGVFTWSEWADALSRELNRPEAAQDGSDYYNCWLRALETILAIKGLASGGEVDGLAAAWERAAHATPHGKPILLENDPQSARAR